MDQSLGPMTGTQRWVALWWCGGSLGGASLGQQVASSAIKVLLGMLDGEARGGVAEGHGVSGSLVRSHGKTVADPGSQPLPGECSNHLRAKRYPTIKDPTATGAGS